MSYLVDALKKAERERHEQRGADIRSVSASDPSQGSTARALRWVVIALVVCNLGLLLYVVWPQSSQTKTDRSTIADTSKPEPAPDGAMAVSSSLSLEDSALRMSQATANRKEAPLRQARANGFDAERPAGQSPAPAAVPGAAQSARGQVTYARSPLDGRTELRLSTREQTPSTQAFDGRVPGVEINGHLYSSVPGRSFILINGRRYHEGERLAAGPAVESIDASGAILNYRGQRYRVAGPG